MSKSVRWNAKIAVGALLLSCVASAAQGAAFGTLEWVNRTGTVSGTETIPVQFRLTLDPASVPLTIGPTNTGGPISGLEQTDLDALELEFPNFQITDTFLNHAFGCGGSFNSSCIAPPPYQFNFSSSFPNRDVSFLPGITSDVLPHGEFVPTPSPAPAGTYFHYFDTLLLEVTGTYGDPLNQTPFSRTFDIASTPCNFSGTDNSCAFQRDITPVPLPGALLLFGAGLAGLAGLGRLKSRMKG